MVSCRWTAEEKIYLSKLVDYADESRTITSSNSFWEEVARSMRGNFPSSTRTGRSCRNAYIRYKTFTEPIPDPANQASASQVSQPSYQGDSGSAVDVREPMECPICYEHLTEPYGARPCGHTFCKRCIDRIRDCAMCGQGISSRMRLYITTKQEGRSGQESTAVRETTNKDRNIPFDVLSKPRYYVGFITGVVFGLTLLYSFTILTFVLNVLLWLLYWCMFLVYFLAKLTLKLLLSVLGAHILIQVCKQKFHELCHVYIGQTQLQTKLYGAVVRFLSGLRHLEGRIKNKLRKNRVRPPRD